MGSYLDIGKKSLDYVEGVLNKCDCKELSRDAELNEITYVRSYGLNTEKIILKQESKTGKIQLITEYKSTLSKLKEAIEDEEIEIFDFAQPMISTNKLYTFRRYWFVFTLIPAAVVFAGYFIWSSYYSPEAKEQAYWSKLWSCNYHQSDYINCLNSNRGDKSLLRIAARYYYVKERALPIYKHLAESGSAEAMYELAMIGFDSDFKLIDEFASKKWLELSTQRGYKMAFTKSKQMNQVDESVSLVGIWHCISYRDFESSNEGQKHSQTFYDHGTWEFSDDKMRMSGDWRKDNITLTTTIRYHSMVLVESPLIYLFKFVELKSNYFKMIRKRENDSLILECKRKGK